MSRLNTQVVSPFRPDRHLSPHDQRGAVMIFALMVLLVMTVLAISGVGNSTLEQRMAGNYSQSMTAFQAAEQGLRVAEEWLFAKRESDTTFKNMDDAAWWFKVTGTSDGLYSAMSTHPDAAKVCNGVDSCEFDPRDESQWCTDGGNPNCKLPKGFATLGGALHGVNLSTVGVDRDGDGAIDSVADQPRFIIEYVGPANVDAPVITFGKPKNMAAMHAFRVTVIAWGQDASARQILQSHVVLRL
jgi:type IV pilus assembly protein PilX